MFQAARHGNFAGSWKKQERSIFAGSSNAGPITPSTSKSSQVLTMKLYWTFIAMHMVPQGGFVDLLDEEHGEGPGWWCALGDAAAECAVRERRAGL